VSGTKSRAAWLASAGNRRSPRAPCAIGCNATLDCFCYYSHPCFNKSVAGNFSSYSKKQDGALLKKNAARQPVATENLVRDGGVR
jgi:hypothetical protein